MTILFAGAFVDCVVLGADTLRHNAADNQPAGYASKIRRINERVFVGKGGYGPSTDGLWDQLATLPYVSRMRPAEIAAQIKVLGAQLYTRCLSDAHNAGIEDPGLFFLVSGWEDDGTSAIHWLNFKSPDFGFAIGPAKCVAYGPGDVSGFSQMEMKNKLSREGNYWTADVGEWAIALFRYCKVRAPHSVGLPLEIGMIDKSSHSPISQIFNEFQIPPGLRRRIGT